MEPTVLKEELVARSRISSLEELESRGRQRVKIIRAGYIAELIDSAVEKALAEQSEQHGGDRVPRAEVEQMLAEARNEAAQAIAEKQAEIERLSAELAAARGGSEQSAGTSPQADAAGATSVANAAADAIANAVDQLNAAMTERLEKMSRKLGISTAVEPEQVNYSQLFEHDDGGGSLESNIKDMKVKSKTGTGIAANLERLKKLKGSD